MAKIEIYKDSKDEWWWRFRADNGKIIADSAEGYHNKSDCLHGIEIIKKQGPHANVVES